MNAQRPGPRRFLLRIAVDTDTATAAGAAGAAASATSTASTAMAASAASTAFLSCFSCKVETFFDRHKLK
jgi:hypothetical protein